MSKAINTANQISDAAASSDVDLLMHNCENSRNFFVVHVTAKNPHTPVAGIELVWMKAWANKQYDFPANDREALIRTIIDSGRVPLVRLVLLVLDRIIKNIRYAKNTNIRKDMLANSLLHAMIKSNEPITHIKRFLPFFEDPALASWGYTIAQKDKFPFDELFNLALNGSPPARAALARHLVKQTRYKALEILREDGADFLNMPDDWLWNVLDWKWMINERYENQ
jgi:hypothetical protein